VGYSLSRLSSLDEARDDWSRLADRQDNVFATWEWATSWWRVYGRGRRQQIYAAHRADGAIAAIIPLSLAGAGPVSIARFIGHGPADQLGPVCAPGDRGAAAEALRRLATDRRPSAGMVVVDRMRADEGWTQALGGHVLAREKFPLLALGGQGWEEWLAARSPNFRQYARGRERRLRRDHELSFRLVTSVDERKRAFETLVALHRARWGSRSTTFDPDRLRFYGAFTDLAARRGWLRLWMAEIDGGPAAAWLGFRFGGADSFYQSGWDPRWDRAGVGSVLLLHTLREAFHDGMREYRMLVGDEPYKRRLMSADPGVEPVAVGPRPLPALAAALASGRRWASMETRRRLGRTPRALATPALRRRGK
jgi:CelD/BcsL family acetyltransferase involved in cellulose biosynthesis